MPVSGVPFSAPRGGAQIILPFYGSFILGGLFAECIWGVYGVAVVLCGIMPFVWCGFGFRGLMAVDSMEFRKFVQSEIKRVMIIYGQGA